MEKKEEKKLMPLVNPKLHKSTQNKRNKRKKSNVEEAPAPV